MAQVTLSGLTKVYDEVVAVDRLDLQVKDKEFVVLLGPSGCGKTTTLRCIAGLEEVTDGDIYIGDRLVNDLDAKDRDIAMVFQSYALYPHMTVYGNMAFPLENARLARKEIDARVRRSAKLLEIESLLDRKPSQLSGGQRQRVALGRAIVREPRVFLMDEPLSNLDAKLRVHMRAELKKLQKDLGITTIYVTHDQVEAMTMADRVALMNGGVLQQYGPPRILYDEPANEFVAGFIGSPPINMIPAQIRRWEIVAPSFRLRVPDGLRSSLVARDGKDVVIGIRPQDVKVFTQRENAPGDAVRGELYTTEPLGDVTIVDVKIGEQLVKAVVPASVDIGHETDLFVHFDPTRIHLFDRETSEAIR